MQTYGNRALDGKSGIYHGHESGDAIGEEGSGTGMNRDEQGLILGTSEKQELFGALNEGFEEGIKSRFNVASLGPWNLLGNSASASDGK